MSGAAPPSEARIVDRSMTHVAGRRGVAASVLALGRHSLRRMLGLRRPLRYKILPAGFATIAYLPAIAFLGMAALIPGEMAGRVLPSPGDFYGTIVVSLVLFTTLAGPQALCPDRRHRTLGLYLASPLDRRSYLLANGVALFAVLFVVTLGPPLLIQIGLALLDVPGPALALLVVRVLAAGVALAVLLGMIGLTGASLTDNRGFAAAGIFVTLLGLGIVSSVLTEALDLPVWVAVLDVLSLALEIAARIHGEESGMSRVATPVVALGWAGWVAALGAVVSWRYRRLAVVR